MTDTSTTGTPRAGHRDAFWLFAAYASLATLALFLSRQPGAVATVWFANALGMAWLVSAPRRHRAGLVVALASGVLFAHLVCGKSIWVIPQFMLVNLAEILLGSWLIVRTGLGERFSNGPAAFLSVLVCGALLPQLLSATLGAAMLQRNGLGDFTHLWLNWYVGSALGAVLVLPLCLKLRYLGWRRASEQLLTLRVATLSLLTAGGALMAFSLVRYPFVYSILPAIAGALVLPPAGGFLLCTVLGLTISSALDYGLIVPMGVESEWKHLLVYMPVLAAVLPAQLLSVVQAQQRRANESLAAITSASNDLKAFFDMEGKVRIVNRSYERYWQRSASTLIGRPVDELVPPEQRSDGMGERVQRAIAGETILRRVTHDFPTMGRRTIDVRYQPAYASDGSRVGVILSGHDVTDLMAVQRSLERTVTELRSANEGLEQFTHMLAHDLREPVNAVLQFTDLIEQDYRDALTGPQQQYFGYVRQGAERMRKMLDGLLQYLRLGSEGSLSVRPVALDVVLNQVLVTEQERIRERDAEIDLDDALPVVRGDLILLVVLFGHLVSNAIKFVPAGRSPRIRVTAFDEGDGWSVVTIEDNGIGISAEQQQHLFRPFKRLHARSKFEGTGLGLAIGRRIAHQLRGEITIESSPGQGSLFHVRLPLAGAEIDNMT